MRGISNNRSKDGKTNSAKTKIQKCDNSSSSKKGILKIVGIGPGSEDHLTLRAINVLKSAEVLVGYSLYINLLNKELLKGKEVISTGMKKEIERCNIAIERAIQGKYTAIVSSGDAGIYGMAGLVLELIIKEGLLDAIDVEIVPGVPALCASSALIGAPIMHDFAVISLSDLMTSWELIKKRLFLMLQGDFVIVLYNPRSSKRKMQFREAIDLIISMRGKDIPVGIVKDATRKGEKVFITKIGEIDDKMVDMRTILIVGNSSTSVYNNLMITSRGYDKKYFS